MQTISKPYAAHGWLVVKASYPDGGEYVFNITNSEKFPLLLYTKGQVTIKHPESGEVVSVREAGFWNKDVENFSRSSWRIVVQPGTEVWCFDATMNKGTVPPAKLFQLDAGMSIDLLAGAKLFMCEGSFSSGDKTVSAPAQVTILEAKTITAISRCLGVQFP